MDVIEAAEKVVELYTLRQLNEALYRQKVCRCRACVARANAWVDWAAGDDDERYEEVQLPPRWERMIP